MWQQITDSVVEFLRNKWIEILGGLVLAAIGWWLGRSRARSQWKKREFLDRLNISLNILRPGEPLQIRTLLEKRCEEVFLNAAGVEDVLHAARHTKPDNPLLPLPVGEYWYFLNAVLNELSERFALGQIRRDMGLPVNLATYVICLTCECAGELRTRKVRAMVIRKDSLQALSQGKLTMPTLERPSHTTRWDTLQILAREYVKQPHQFLEVELAV